MREAKLKEELEELRKQQEIDDVDETVSLASATVREAESV